MPTVMGEQRGMRMVIRKEKWKEFWEQSKNYAPTNSEFQHKQLLQT